uniref:Uncharacterized protein n=1 Tax=Ignisphaera aggregans TaxID=334771 RepID=A0A7C2VBH5_9CREN
MTTPRRIERKRALNSLRVTVFRYIDSLLSQYPPIRYGLILALLTARMSTRLTATRTSPQQPMEPILHPLFLYVAIATSRVCGART